MTKAEGFKAEATSRGEELEALAEAACGKKATGGAEGIAYGFTQASFFQRSRTAFSAGLAHFEIVARLVDEAAVDVVKRHSATRNFQKRK